MNFYQEHLFYSAGLVCIASHAQISCAQQFQPLSKPARERYNAPP